MNDRPKTILSISVRELAAFVLRSGDLHPRRLGAPTSALEGIWGHQRVQRSRPEGYRAEVSVRHSVDNDRFTLEITGRADGVYENRTPMIVEEIKTTRLDFVDIPDAAERVHLGQAKLYAYLYAREHQLTEITVRLTYYHIDSRAIQSKDTPFQFEDLEVFFNALSGDYLRWAGILYDWRALRNEAIESLSFPFPEYREGQRRLAVMVYRTVRDGKRLFAQAPTGIGKTVGTLFPAIKAQAEGRFETLFFLTAKTVGRCVAEQSFELMRQNGLRYKSLTLTARDKICFDAPCDPDQCEFAKGYYDRVRSALETVYARESFSRETILEAARTHRLCPFEFSLDLAHLV